MVGRSKERVKSTSSTHHNSIGHLECIIKFAPRVMMRGLIFCITTSGQGCSRAHLKSSRYLPHKG